jgi:peptidoglycan/LPS O-acetylase OafA/YrhL
MLYSSGDSHNHVLDRMSERNQKVLDPEGSRTDSPRPLPRTRVPELDGLRGVAISLVVLWHYFFGPNFNWDRIDQSTVPRWALPFAFTWSGVDLFFVLSGFLLTNVLLDAKDSTGYYKVFYLRRAFRILPLYLLVFIPFVLFHLSGGSLGPTDTIPVWAYAIFGQNIVGSLYGDFGYWWMGVTWSLAVEEHFYLLLPVLVRRLSIRGLAKFSIAAIVAAPLLRASILTGWPGPNGLSWHAIYLATPCRIDALGCGVLATIVYRAGLPTSGIGRLRLYALFVALFVLNAWQLGLGWNVHSIRSGVFGFSLLAWFYAVLLLVIVSQPRDALGRLMKNGLLIKLGSLSYAIYMFHTILLWLAHLLLNGKLPSTDDPKAVIISLGALAATICLAMFSKVWLEGPAMRIGHSFKY